jgi:hypothetical protein
LDFMIKPFIVTPPKYNTFVLSAIKNLYNESPFEI